MFRVRPLVQAALAMGAGVAFGALSPGTVDSAPRHFISLGVQSCTTACQSAFTDCLLGCDAELPCEQLCVQEVNACVAGCLAPPPEPTSSAAPAPSAPGASPAPGAK